MDNLKDQRKINIARYIIKLKLTKQSDVKFINALAIHLTCRKLEWLYESKSKNENELWFLGNIYHFDMFGDEPEDLIFITLNINTKLFELREVPCKLIKGQFNPDATIETLIYQGEKFEIEKIIL